MRLTRSTPTPPQRTPSRRRRSVRAGSIIAASVVLLAGLILPAGPATASPRPQLPHSSGQPDLGDNVVIFSPTMPQAQIQATVDAIATQQISNQFGTQRYSLFFRPGSYGTAAAPLKFDVGYYTQVAGLGQEPGDVTINGSVDVHNQCFTNDDGSPNCIALDNFWRSMSNLTINVAGGSGCQTATEFWAVSQAAPMRRVVVNGGVSLMDYCTARPAVRQRWLHRRFQVHRWNCGERLAATVPGPQQRPGRLEQQRLEPGVLRHHRSAGHRLR